MSTRFNLPHVNITNSRQTHLYKSHRSNFGGSSATFDRQEHGERLLQELSDAFINAESQKSNDDRLDPATGIYLEVKLRPSSKADVVDRKSSGVKSGATKIRDDDRINIALYVPDDAKEDIESILNDYTSGELTKKKKPQKKNIVEAISEILEANLETFWTDKVEELPSDDEEIWWEVWCFKDFEKNIDIVLDKLNVQSSSQDNRLYFPETVVIPVFTTRSMMKLIVFSGVGVSELRRANDTPIFFTEDERETQQDWVYDLAGRIIWPDSNVPAVCLFDTGVNRAHPLIEPALSSQDMLSVKSEWATSDTLEGHGTGMAGLAVHGDLISALADTGNRHVKHRLESVKFLAPAGFDSTEPRNYGVITQLAVAKSEINNPDRLRVFCMAVTNDKISGYRPTTWSAAIDQAASGTMGGDDESQDNYRLFIVSTGNAPSHIKKSDILKPEDYPAEDPSQAWNILTVGGYTDKINITEADDIYKEWKPFAAVGELSPFTRTSTEWLMNKTAYKPDIVMEAGNRAINENGTEVYTLDSLSLLSTGSNVDQLPLTTFSATSAATAQAARLAARLFAEYPNYWPETIRALIVHSAEWSNPMREQISPANKTDACMLLRKFGYGIPNFERAVASAKNHLALVTQTEIQPFKRKGREFNECHYYKLPWPKEVLEKLGENNIRLKVTLSYFIEPNPGLTASINPQHYQSFGLRFDLRRKSESLEQFYKRVNAFEVEGKPDTISDDGWTFGANSISAGSLHSDEWNGSAVDLLTRDVICIKPVIGWWRNRSTLDDVEKKARYSLVITLSTEDIEIDLHTPISTLVDIETNVDIQVKT